MRSLYEHFVWTASDRARPICNDLLCEQDVASESLLANMYTLIFTHFRNRVLVDICMQTRLIPNVHKNTAWPITWLPITISILHSCQSYGCKSHSASGKLTYGTLESAGLQSMSALTAEELLLYRQLCSALIHKSVLSKSADELLDVDFA
jgi:hypothetical protein